MDDFGLLRAYATEGNESAFTALTDRYVNLVYSAALRQVNDPHLAEEVTQVVFVLLARKAHTFRQDVILSGWLLRATRFTSTNVRVRSIPTHPARTTEAAQNGNQYLLSDNAAWQQIVPFLDEAIAHPFRGGSWNALALRILRKEATQGSGASPWALMPIPPKKGSPAPWRNYADCS